MKKIYKNGGDFIKDLSINERIRLCLLIEKIGGDKDYSKKLELENCSTFCKRKVEQDKTNLVKNRDFSKEGFYEREKNEK